MGTNLSLVKYFSLLFFLFSLVACNNVSNPIGNTKIDAGIKGIVTDTLGQPLENVEIYCLYYTNYIPIDPLQNYSMLKTLNKSDFDFNLEQNFPNPFSNSTFLRFSLPNSSQVTFTIVNLRNENFVYQFSKEFSGGYFQLYLNNIVDSLKLQNGPYSYTLTAKTANGTTFTDSKELFVISDKGTPNSLTNIKGNYIFNYKDIFAGDSLKFRYSEFYSYNINLTGSIFLLFKKEGYYSTTKYFTLYHDFVLTNDIVLTKEN